MKIFMVGGAGISDEDFVGDSPDRFDARNDVVTFVPAGNQDCEFLTHVAALLEVKYSRKAQPGDIL